MTHVSPSATVRCAAARRLATPRCRQQHEPHEGAERSRVRFSRAPDAPQFVVGQYPLARPLPWMCAGRHGPARSRNRCARRANSARSSPRDSTRSAAHRPVVVGDLIEDAGVLAALDLGDRQPSQPAAQISSRSARRWPTVRSRGPSRRRYSSLIAAACRSRPPALADAASASRLPGHCRPWPHAVPWWPARAPPPVTAAYPVSGGVGFGHAALGQHGPKVSFRCTPRNRYRTMKHLSPLETRPRAARCSRGRNFVTLGAGLQVGDGNCGERLGHTGVSQGYQLKVVCVCRFMSQTIPDKPEKQGLQVVVV